MRLLVFLCLAALVAACCAAGPKDAGKAKSGKTTTPASDSNADDQTETLDGLPEACRQPVQEPNGKKPAKDAKASAPLCTLRKPYYDDNDQASHFCIVCMQNDTAKKPGTGPAAGAGGDADISKQLAQVVLKQLSKNEDFDDNSGLTILIQGVDKPINISKALDDPNNDSDDVLQNMEEVLYIFKNKTVAKVDYKNGEPSGEPEEVDCPECEKQIKDLKPQKLTAQQKQQQANKRRQSEDRQNQKNRNRGTTQSPDEDENGDDSAHSEDANGGGQDSRRGGQQDARRRQYEEQQRMRDYEQQRRQPQYAPAAAAYYQPQQASSYQPAQQRRASPASGSGGASTRSVPSVCKQEVHFTTEDGICSLHVPESTNLCITCRGDRADAYQILQSLDSLAQRLSPNNYQYLSQNAEIDLVFDPAPRDNRVFDFSREFAQHQPMVEKLEEAYYFFPNQSVTVQKFDDSGRDASVEPFRTYDDYLRRYQREHEQQDQDRSQEQQPSPYPDAAGRDYNQDYYRRQQEQYRQQQLDQQRQQPSYQQSTDVYGRVYPSTAAARSPYDQQQEDQRRREAYEAQLRQQRIQPTATYTPTVYATADYYRTQTTPAYTPTTTTPAYDYYRTQTTPTATPAYGRTYAYTDRTSQPAYGTMMVSVVTLQPTSTITVTADQYGNVVRPTAYAPYIRPDQRGQKHTMVLVIETTMATPQADQYRMGTMNERSPVRPMPYAGQPGIYPRT